MKTHVLDKLLSMGMVLAGLSFLAFVPRAENGNLYMVGIVVVVGGVLGLVNAQVLAPVMQILERQLGLPLSVPSTASLPPQSSAALSPGGSAGTSTSSGSVNGTTAQAQTQGAAS